MQRTLRGLKLLVIGLFIMVVATPAMAQKLGPGTVVGSGGGTNAVVQASQANKDRGATNPVEDTVPETAEMAKAREKVQFLLSGFEYFPTRSDLDAVASAPVLTTILKSFVRDSEVSPAMRFRAVDALGLYQESDVGKFLLQYISAPAETTEKAEVHTLEMMRHRAIIAYSKSQGSKGNDALIPMLEEPDLQIRLTAISALGKHGGPEAIKYLRALKEQDTHHAVQRELHKFVR